MLGIRSVFYRDCMAGSKDNVIKVFNAKYPERQVNYVVDYDRKSYVVNATLKGQDPEKEMDPYYTVLKKNGEIKWFPIASHFPKFYKAYKKRRL